MSDTDLAEVSLLESLRHDRGISLARAVKETGVSHKTIRSYERDPTEHPHPTSLRKLADYYEVSPALILNDMRIRARRLEADRAAA